MLNIIINKVCFWIILFFSLLTSSVEAQQQTWHSNSNWDKYRHEIILGLGATNFLGDLGGLDRIGTDYSMVDMEYTLTKPAVHLNYRYRLNRYWSLRTNIFWGIIRGDDKLTQEPFRNNRNLSFKSNIFEVSEQIEFNFISYERKGQMYLRKIHGMKNIDMLGYVFIGVGGLYFNPKSFYNNNWYALQPLSTEGQGMRPGTKKYRRVTACIPIGIGFRHNISKKWNVGMELGFRKTFSDYLDDVSTVYYDRNLIATQKGDIAAHFSDPSLAAYPAAFGGNSSGSTQTLLNQQRGDSKQKDAYIFATITFTYKIKSNYSGHFGKRKLIKAKF